MEQSIQLIQLTTAQLQDLISKGVRKELDSLRQELLKKENKEDILSREETAKYLGINLSTLWRWTRKEKIKAHSIHGKTFYKRKDISDALQPVIVR